MIPQITLTATTPEWVISRVSMHPHTGITEFMVRKGIITTTGIAIVPYRDVEDEGK
jgi:hypothetical protein